MAFEIAVQLPQLEQVLNREKASLGPGGIEQGRGVAFGENKAVVIVVVGVFRVVTHVPEEQRGDQVGR